MSHSYEIHGALGASVFSGEKTKRSETFYAVLTFCLLGFFFMELKCSFFTSHEKLKNEIDCSEKENREFHIATYPSSVYTSGTY